MKVNLTAEFPQTVRDPQDYWDTRLPGHGLRVSALGEKSWTLMYRCNRRLRRLTLGTYPTLSLGATRALRFIAFR